MAAGAALASNWGVIMVLELQWARHISSDLLDIRCCRYDEVIDSLAPVVNSTLGQMLDDFFQYANDLQQSLDEHGKSMVAGQYCMSSSCPLQA